MLISFLLPAFVAIPQYRIAVDVNTTLDSYFIAGFFCPVLKHNFYLRAGFSHGNYGNGSVYDGQTMRAPYPIMNDRPENPALELLGYRSKNKGSGLEIGIGKYIKLGVLHTLRFDLQLKGYHIHESIGATYVLPSTSDSTGYFYHFDLKKNCLSLGPEIFHAIRLSSRLTVYYGLKLPYFLPIRTKRYQPHTMKDLTAGFQPNIAVGLSYGFEKRRKKRPKSEK